MDNELKAVIDVKQTIGGAVIFNKVAPSFKYENNQKTDEVIGTKLNCIFPARGFKTSTVTVLKNDVEQLQGLLDDSDTKSVMAKLVNPVIKCYVHSGRFATVALSVKCDDVEVVKTNER